MKKLLTLITVQYTLFVLMGTFAPHTASAITHQGGYVSFTFDDGYLSTYTEALPALEANGLRGTAYVTKTHIGKSGYMNWKQVVDLQNVYYWEIGSHSLTHAEIPTLSAAAIRKEINQSKTFLTKKGLTIETFAFPYGAYNNIALIQTHKNYLAARGFWDRDALNQTPYSFWVLQVQSVEKGTSVSQIKQWIDEAHTQNKWLILVYHDLKPEESDDPYVTKINELHEAATYAKTSGATVLPVNEVIHQSHENIIWQDDFKTNLTKWSDKVGATKNTGSNGQYPDPKNSLQLKTTKKIATAYVRSESLSIPTTSHSQVSLFANTTGIKNGSAGVYIDEYDSAGNWISGQLIGAIANEYIGNVVFDYTPTDNSVATSKIQIYLDGTGSNTVYIDNVALYNY